LCFCLIFALFHSMLAPWTMSISGRDYRPLMCVLCPIFAVFLLLSFYFLLLSFYFLLLSFYFLLLSFYFLLIHTASAYCSRPCRDKSCQLRTVNCQLLIVNCSKGRPNVPQRSPISRAEYSHRSNRGQSRKKRTGSTIQVLA